MKNSTTILLCAAGTILAGVFSSSIQAAETGEAPPPRPAMRGRGPAPLPPEIMSIYDVDGNGVLDQDERAVLDEHIASGEVTVPRAGPRGRGFGGPGPNGAPPEIVAQYDANHDGVLDATEREALHADVQAGKVQLPERPRGAGPMRVPPAIVAQYDTDKDGALNDTERAALRADVAAGKVQLPDRGAGRRGFGRGGPPPAPPAGADTPTP